MKLFAPKYYRNFVCIADKCTHSCCVGWEIDVDENTLDKYATITHPYGDVIRSNIDNTDYPHFKLLENDRCPHLDDCGLCKIIKNLGEDFLCDIVFNIKFILIGIIAYITDNTFHKFLLVLI